MTSPVWLTSRSFAPQSPFLRGPGRDPRIGVVRTPILDTHWGGDILTPREEFGADSEPLPSEQPAASPGQKQPGRQEVTAWGGGEATPASAQPPPPPASRSETPRSPSLLFCSIFSS